MTIELWVNGDRKKIWIHESEYLNVRGQLGFKKREEELNYHIREIKESPEFILKTVQAEHWQLIVRVNSSLRCSEVIDDNPLLNTGKNH